MHVPTQKLMFLRWALFDPGQLPLQHPVICTYLMAILIGLFRFELLYDANLLRSSTLDKLSPSTFWTLTTTSSLPSIAALTAALRSNVFVTIEESCSS